MTSVMVARDEVIAFRNLFSIGNEGQLYKDGLGDHIDPPWRITITYEPYKSERRI